MWIDYTTEDFTQNGEIYDIIFDAVGKISKKKAGLSLNPDSHYLTIRTLTKESSENLLLLKDMIEAGHLRPYIDKCYSLEQLADAHRYVESGRKRGNVVINIISNSASNKQKV